MGKQRLIQTFLFCFFFTTFSGVLRKWVFMSTTVGNAFFATQLLLPLVFFFTSRRAFGRLFLNTAFPFYLLLLVAEAFNPLNLTIYHGLLGILIHSYFWIFIFLYLQNREDITIQSWIWPVLVVVLGEVVLGMVQYQQPATSFINRYANLEAVSGNIANVGKAVRVTGTFSYIGGYGALLIAVPFLVGYIYKKGYSPNLVLGLMGAGLVGCFISGSRGVTYIYAIELVLVIITQWRSFRQVRLTALFIPVVILGLFFTLYGNFGEIGNKIADAFNNFNNRRETLVQNGEESRRIEGDIPRILNFQGNYPLFGVGLGATYQGATQFFGTSPYVEEFGYVEGELIRVILEGGFVLFFMRFFMAWYLASRLAVPTLLKFLVFGLVFYAVVWVFNIYNAFYLAFGIILIDQAYYRRAEAPLAAP
ncbi:MAG: hypothetical protein EKK39_11665 [Sphingobacteriales bacterium]|uniref:hypothetical protein n=1 Tax=Hydrotalea flava TaxID=714549 RepID=UPI00082CBD1E|nr:hypothetical protein [Hydrotalea flava]RTL49073.1 MAG: hypothetical protein EKK39_11665 [Sphingobacteriales bacterium]